MTTATKEKQKTFNKQPNEFVDVQYKSILLDQQPVLAVLDNNFDNKIQVEYSEVAGDFMIDTKEYRSMSKGRITHFGPVNWKEGIPPNTLMDEKLLVVDKEGQISMLLDSKQEINFQPQFYAIAAEIKRETDERFNE